MADKPAGERTEQPTPRRLRKAREDGQAPQSQELPAVASIVALLLAFVAGGSGLFGWFRELIRNACTCNFQALETSGAFMKYASGIIKGMIGAMSPFFIAVFVAGVMSTVVVSGLNFSPKAVKFKLSAISPVKGFKKLFGIQSVIKLVLSVLKLIFVGMLVWFYLDDKLESMASLRWAWPDNLLKILGEPVLGIMIRICIGLIIIALIDVAFQKWKYIRDLKMTKQEIKEERKSEEGSPEVKSKIRQQQMAMASKRMLAEVPKADVVLVNPTHVAVALKYDSKKSDAPVVIAKGGDHLCERIKEVARSYGVPIVRRPKLARTIFANVELDQSIPESLFMAVAEVLAMIQRMRQRRQ
ncbi:Flagellar biosynthetic protein FlhB [Anaerohalosphaera lusitana]|uniref:Flagellar biosynthetic protein FlhB n=1 Tax=Anaerohalosphaera lusitana TaxID=1936003 RepID=A0A1U9NGL9_9BACT|nr:flagellar biosynthesis protein FlhB [Anaerohalosphaera lusitana]AQT66907.1 Flagellar biosynthetic protein FlhB [Anaerohalosphaera lusitana]